MSLEVTSIVDQKNATGYDQITAETVVASSASSKSSYQLQEGRTDKNLKSESSSSKHSNQKIHIAFTLSFSIPFTSPYPIEPGSNC